MREFFWKIAKWFLFRLDAEQAHRLTVFLIRIGIVLKSVPLQWVSGAGSVEKSSTSPAIELWGIPFRSRLGLAAGFDKNAEILTGLPALGFGFAEIGTVTPRPQPGNSLPRLFRDPAQESLFNRMGFNGLGAAVISRHLAQARELLPENFRVGVNIGKNKDTPIEKAREDYVLAARAFEGLADYLVMNVSSPNTPGLRSLQTVEALQPILEDVGEVISGWKRRPPLLLKIAPELSGLELTHLLQALESHGIDGWVLTNTLGGAFQQKSQQWEGGWSGRVLMNQSRRSLQEARKASQKPIVSVGGICSPDEAIERLSEGADLIQVYTGWIFGGPSFPVQVQRRLCQYEKSRSAALVSHRV